MRRLLGHFAGEYARIAKNLSEFFSGFSESIITTFTRTACVREAWAMLPGPCGTVTPFSVALDRVLPTYEFPVRRNGIYWDDPVYAV